MDSRKELRTHVYNGLPACLAPRCEYSDSCCIYVGAESKPLRSVDARRDKAVVSRHRIV